MTQYSFLIYTHSKRFNNLQTTLDILLRREREIFRESEFLVVTQDRLPSVFNRHPNLRVVEMDMDHFNKAKMVNASVREAKGKKIVMLDGDRILPAGYFTKHLQAVRPGQIITTLPLYRLAKQYSIADINLGHVEKIADHRDPSNTPGKKNAMSGNTIMFRKDFWRAGGMDETYVNYGCTDLDFTLAVMKAGMEIVYTQDEEWHLWHTFDMPKSQFLIVNCKSVLKFCRKWGKPVPEFFMNILKDKNNMVMMV